MPRSMPLREAAEEYLDYRRAHGDAANTIANHGQLLRKALACWGNVTVANIEPRHVSRLFAENQWAPSTRNLYLANLRQFFAWARANRYMRRDDDPTATWGNVRVPAVDKLRIPVHEFYDLLNACRHPRDRAICALGLFTFSRGSEISAMRIEDLDLGAGTLRIFRQKTGDRDSLPVSTELRDEMNRWLNWYRQDQGTLRPEWYLVPAKKPDVWDRDPDTGRLVLSERHASVRPERKEEKPYRAVQRPLSVLCYETGNTGLHTLRRSGARALADRLRGEGYDGALLRVASMLGHRDTKVTERYIGWQLERSQRDAMIAGQPLFPDLTSAGSLRLIREAEHG